MITTAFVKIWGETVGAIAWDQENKLGSFEYEPNFPSFGWELSPLQMPLSEARRIFSFPSLRADGDSPYDTFKGLPGLLADVLPDKYGNQLINAWLAQNGRPANSMNPIEILCFIGTRGMGALEFEPAQYGMEIFDLEIKSLVDVAQKMLNDRLNFQVNVRKDELKSMQEILKIGTSAGGARPKAIIAYNPETEKIKSGQGDIPDDFEHWMIKLDGVSDAQFGDSLGYGRIEMAYYKMALACEINMMECKLLYENNRAHFMTKRFDRGPQNEKYHVQTFCAMEHFDFNQVTSYSYEQLFQTMRKLRLSYPDAAQMFRRMVFNVVAKNCDDHTKNFSFRMKKNQTWELSPAYDVCYAYRPDSIWVSQHALSVNGKRKNISREDLLQVARSMNIKKANSMIDHIVSVVAEWETFAREQEVDEKKMNAIRASLVQLS